MTETANLNTTAAEPSFESLAKAVDDAATEVAKLDEVPRKAAGELRAAVEDAHRAGLVTIVRRLRADDAGRALLYELVDDPLIRMLFSLHGIIRTDAPSGVGAAGEHTTGGRTGHEHAGHEHAGDGQPGCGCGTGTDRGCGCGSGNGYGVSEPHGVPKQSQAIIPLSAVRRRDALEIWPGSMT